MIQFLILLLSTVGLTWIVVFSKLFKRLREIFTIGRMLYEPKSGKPTFKYRVYWFFETLTSCHGCFGFWAGASCYVIQLLGLEIILFGFIGTSISLLFFNLIKK